MPDPVMPSQFFNVARADTPGRRLMMAVLEGAVADVELYRRHPNNVKAVRRYLDVKAWVEETGARDVMAFETVCEHLGFDPGTWRRELLTVREPRTGTIYRWR